MTPSEIASLRALATSWRRTGMMPDEFSYTDAHALLDCIERLESEVDTVRRRAEASEERAGIERRHTDAARADVDRLRCEANALNREANELIARAEAAEAERDRLRVQKDGAYAERDRCVAALARLAIKLGYPVGLAEHPAEDAAWDADWRAIVLIDLPTGQASWHFHDSERVLLAGMPLYPGAWDGHSTDEKYARLAALSGAAGEP